MSARLSWIIRATIRQSPDCDARTENVPQGQSAAGGSCQAPAARRTAFARYWRGQRNAAGRGHQTQLCQEREDTFWAKNENRLYPSTRRHPVPKRTALGLARMHV